MTLLPTYNSKNPLKQHMIKLVQHMYKARAITHFKTANTALDLLTSKSGTNTFQSLFTSITQFTTKNTDTFKLNT